MLPSISITKANMEARRKAMDNGASDGFSNRLINTEIPAPKPINAEAVPAFLSKGARVRAAVLGLAIPTQPSNPNRKIMVTGRFSQSICRKK